MRQPNQQALAEALSALETGVAKPVQASRLSYAEARADLEARARAGETTMVRNNKGQFTGSVRVATFGRPVLPSIFTVEMTADGRHQPMRNGEPYFEAFDDFISAHCAAKAAEERAQARYARLTLRMAAE